MSSQQWRDCFDKSKEHKQKNNNKNFYKILIII